MLPTVIYFSLYSLKHCIARKVALELVPLLELLPHSMLHFRLCIAATGLLSEMVRHLNALQAAQVVMAVCHIAVVQPQVTQLPKKTVKASAYRP